MFKRFFASNTYHLFATLTYKLVGRQVGMTWRGVGHTLISPYTVPRHVIQSTRKAYSENKEETKDLGRFRQNLAFVAKVGATGWHKVTAPYRFVVSIPSRIDAVSTQALKAVDLADTDKMTRLTPEIKEALKAELKSQWVKHVEEDYPAHLRKKIINNAKADKVDVSAALSTAIRKLRLDRDAGRELTHHARDRLSVIDTDAEQALNTEYIPSVSIDEFDGVFDEAVVIRFEKTLDKRNGFFKIEIAQDFVDRCNEDKFDVNDKIQKAAKDWVNGNIRRPEKRRPLVALVA